MKANGIFFGIEVISSFANEFFIGFRHEKCKKFDIGLGYGLFQLCFNVIVG